MKSVTLGEIAKWGSGGTPKRSVAEYFGQGVPWLSIADLNDGVVSEAKESLTDAGLANSSATVVPAGTLLIAMYGSIGKLGIAGTEVCTSQAIAYAAPDADRVTPRYLFHYLLAQRPALQRRGRGGTQMNIGQADLRGWPIPLPSLDEQRRIAAILDKADEIRTKRREALAQLRALPQSIIRDVATTANEARPLRDIAQEFRYGTSNKAGPQGLPALRIPNVIGGSLDLGEIKTVEVSAAEARRLTLEDGACCS